MYEINILHTRRVVYNINGVPLKIYICIDPSLSISLFLSLPVPLSLGGSPFAAMLVGKLLVRPYVTISNFGIERGRFLLPFHEKKSRIYSIAEIYLPHSFPRKPISSVHRTLRDSGEVGFPNTKKSFVHV